MNGHRARWRRSVAAVCLAVVAVGGAGCQAQSGPKASDLQSWLTRDSAVATAHATSEGDRFHAIAHATAELRPGADAAAFRGRLGSYLRGQDDLKTAQVDVSGDGVDGFSVVADQARTDASVRLGETLRREVGATQAQGFIGDVEVAIPQPGEVVATFDKLAGDAAVTSVSQNGTLRVRSGDMELGKVGSQPLDPSFHPAIRAAMAAGATAVRAIMDRYHGPAVDVTAADPMKLGGILDGMRANGYTGPANVRTQNLVINDDAQIPLLPWAAQVARLPGVKQVSLTANHVMLEPRITSAFRVDLDDPTALTRVAQVLDTDESREKDLTDAERTARHHDLAALRTSTAKFSLVLGPSHVDGSPFVLLDRAAVVQSLVHQQGVDHVVADDSALTVAIDAGRRDQLGTVIADLRAHRWMGNRTIELQLIQGDKVVDRARFDSTATGVASIADGATNSHDLIDAWDATATK